MKKIIAIGIALVGILLIVFSSFGMTQELSDSDVVDAMLPPCTVEDGLPLVGDDEVTCYWGMSVEVLEIPKEAVAANVDVEITWEKSGVCNPNQGSIGLLLVVKILKHYRNLMSVGIIKPR